MAIAGGSGETTFAISYVELRARVEALAVALQVLDPTPGSRVGICARNSAPHLTALLAIYASGKVWVPLSPRNGRAELDAMIAATRPSILVADASGLERITPTDAALVRASTNDGEPDTIDALVAQYAGQVPERIERGDEDEQIIKFSGGSTGRPKPVVQSVRCLNAQADGLRDFFAFAADDVNLIAAPLTHGASCFVLPLLEVGGCHVLVAEPKAQEIFDTIARFGVTTMYAPPTLLYALMGAHDELEVARPSFASLRHVIYSAAPMTPERIRDCQRFFGPVIETAYGQVEAPQIISAMRADELLLEENLTSVGRPSSVVTVATMNAEGTVLPPGEVGEIVVRGPLLMSGYIDRDEENARAIVDGWLRTGDIGVIDARGYLYIRGRLREMINSGGFKLFPAEVETALGRHPDVAECAVFGVPDAKWGEAVNAAVVVQSGAAVEADALIAFVKAELGSVKAPKRIWFVDHLERNAAGKVSRGGVRASLLGL